MIVQYSETAEHQLVAIWRHSRRQWGEARADRYVAALYEAAQLASEGRRLLQPRPDVMQGLSMIRSGSHHIYVALDAGREVMHVVAILHQRMEAARHIKGEGEGP